MKEINADLSIETALKVMNAAEKATEIWWEIYYRTGDVRCAVAPFSAIETCVLQKHYDEAYHILFALHGLNNFKTDIPWRRVSTKKKHVALFVDKFIKASEQELLRMDRMDDEESENELEDERKAKKADET